MNEVDLYNPDAHTKLTDTESILLITQCQKKGMELFYLIAKQLYYRKLAYERGEPTEYKDWAEYCKFAGYRTDRASDIAREFPLMDEAVRLGLVDKLFSIRQQDIIKHARLYLEYKYNSIPGKEEIAAVLDVAIAMDNRDEFRKWYTEQVNNDTEIKPEKLSITSRKALAWDKFRESLILKDTSLCDASELVGLMDDTLEKIQ